MNVAAGVILIIAAIFNGCAGVGYTAVGGGAAAVGSNAAEINQAAAAQAAEDGVEVSAQLTKEDADALKAQGGGLMFFGIFLFAMLGLQIAGAVTLFTKKAATFIIVVGVLGLVAEGVGVAMTGAMGLSNIVGVVGSLLAVVAALSIKKAANAAAQG